MRRYFTMTALVLGLMLFISSELFKNVLATSIRQQCGSWLAEAYSFTLNRPQLTNQTLITLTKYKRMHKLQLLNQGGFELLFCDGFNFPAGLEVKLTLDGKSCEIHGTPMQAQASTMAYVVAGNASGRSVAEVPIAVNALLLRE